MTTETQETQKKEPNPYNMNKPWHDDVEDIRMDNASTLFIPPKPAKSKADESDENQSTQEKEAQPDKKDKAEKRYFDLKAHHDKTVSELREKLKELEEKASQSSTLPKNEEELKAFKEKNPDLFDMVKQLAQLEAERQNKEVKEKLTEYEQDRLKAKAQEAVQKIREAHPDYEDLKSDDDFHTWAEQQTEEIQSWIYNNPYNATNAIKAITLYKAETGKIAKQSPSKESSSAARTVSDDAASLVTTRTQDAGGSKPKVWTQEEIKRMSLDEYEQYREEILKQVRSRG